MKLGVLTTGALGWKTLAGRWRRHMPGWLAQTPVFLDVQDFEGWESKLPKLRRLPWLRAALRGRRAARAAIAVGCDKLFVCTIVDAPLLPLGAARYVVYGDATPRQLDALYYGDAHDTPRKRFLRARVSRLGEHGHVFACMSEWYREGVMEDYGVSSANARMLRPFVDTELWTPQERSPEQPLRMLFVGADFDRKGGDVIIELAGRFDPGQLEWHVVTKEPAQAPAGVFFHTGLQADSEALVSLARSCDAFVFPTRADCSPLAVVEAASSGLAVAATRLGGIPDMVADGLSGHLASEPTPDEFEQIIRRWLDDSELIVRQGRAGRERALALFSAKAHGEQLLECLA